MERNVLVGGEVLLTHPKDSCLGEYCTIHNMSDHHMVTWTQKWNEYERRIDRICPHDVKHPDPDEISKNISHTCDGCCIPGYEPDPEFQADVSDLMTVYESENSYPPLGGVHLHAGMDPIAELEKLIKSIRRTPHEGVDIETN